MVQIKRWEEIDETKLRSLFKKRGHGILYDNFLDQVKAILDGNPQGFEIHQCDCGELMILSVAHVEELKKKYHSENISCKVCKGYEGEVLNFQFLNRFSEITSFIDEKSIFVTRSEQTLKPQDVETLGRMALGLFPTSTAAETMVGYYDFMKIFFKHFPGTSFKSLLSVKKLLDDALKANEGEFGKLYLNVCDWKKTHHATMSIYSKEDILATIASQGSIKSLNDNLVENKKLDVKRARIQLELSTYQDIVEIDVYLDFLANLLNIVKGDKIVENPFSVLTLPPLKGGGRPRKVNTLADKVEYLQRNLPFKIKSMYNTHLRNAIAHNELEICLDENLLLLTGYSEKLTFDEFHRIFRGVKNLQGSINTYLADYQIAKSRPKVINQGIAAAILNFTDFFEEEGKVHPKAPCDAQLNLYQYWDFATFNKNARVFPKYEMKFDENSRNMSLDFGENGALFIFPEAPELSDWLEQIILTNQIHVVLYTIAPTLPFFAKKVMMRCPVGKLMDVYVLSIDEETATILPQLIKNAFKFLKCP